MSEAVYIGANERAFSVARSATSDVIDALRSAVSEAIESGDGIAEFRARFRQSLSATARRATKPPKKNG